MVEYYLGSEERFLSPRSYQGLLEVSHFHLFAMGMLLLVLTHLVLFVPLANRVKAWLIALPFAAALLDEGAGWLVRFVHPGFAYAKIAGFLLLAGQPRRAGRGSRCGRCSRARSATTTSSAPRRP